MRYAIFTDIHANLEALEAVLEKIDEIARKKPIDQIWFLGDLVGYGPNPNECITTLRERTDVIIAGNHDWAAVGKIDLEDFSSAARISAEWTAEQLTEEHRTFLADLPERLELDECTLVHGSPYGPLWEYLTSEVLAERSFQYFSSRYCFVGHTHVPVIFQQADSIANAPTLPLVETTENGLSHHEVDTLDDEEERREDVDDVEAAEDGDNADGAVESEQPPSLDDDDAHEVVEGRSNAAEEDGEGSAGADEVTPEEIILSAEDRLNSEIEELLTLLGLSESMIQVTNEMFIPP